MVKRSVPSRANAAQAFATCRREASSCPGKTATRLVIKARRLFPRTATRPVDQNHKLPPRPLAVPPPSPSAAPRRGGLPPPFYSQSVVRSSRDLSYLSLFLLFRLALSLSAAAPLRRGRHFPLCRRGGRGRPASPVPSRPVSGSGNLRKSTGYQVLMANIVERLPGPSAAPSGPRPPSAPCPPSRHQPPPAPPVGQVSRDSTPLPFLPVLRFIVVVRGPRRRSLATSRNHHPPPSPPTKPPPVRSG